MYFVSVSGNINPFVNLRQKGGVNFREFVSIFVGLIRFQNAEATIHKLKH
jgi:hypothetical protein